MSCRFASTTCDAGLGFPSTSSSWQAVYPQRSMLDLSGCRGISSQGDHQSQRTSPGGPGQMVSPPGQGPVTSSCMMTSTSNLPSCAAYLIPDILTDNGMLDDCSNSSCSYSSDDDNTSLSPTSCKEIPSCTNAGTDQEDHLSKSEKQHQHKYVPHSQKPVQVVVKRNARERRRVQTINGAFSVLRRHLPYENRHKRLSKVKTLQIAIEYIDYLRTMVGGDEDINSLNNTQMWSSSQTDEQNLKWLQQHFVSHFTQYEQCSPS